MTCASCVSTVESTVKKIDGIGSATVNLLANSARVTFDGSKITAKTIAEKISEIGYTSFPVETASSGHALFAVNGAIPSLQSTYLTNTA